MNKAYLKLVAKRRLINNIMVCYLVSVLPFLVFFLSAVFNYYLPFFLKKTLGDTDIFTNTALRLLCVIISFCLWKSVCLVKAKYFIMKTFYRKVKLSKVVKSIKFKKYVTYLKVSVLRGLLSVSWSVVYFLPCLTVAGLLVYTYRFENYGRNIHLTLFVSSILLFLIGAYHFFVTLKRYSMCELIILKDNQENSLEIIAESISRMEKHSFDYSYYCISFTGWIFSCAFIVPMLYVLPFVNMSKWCYMMNVENAEKRITENEKPIIFYIRKRKEV